MVINTVKPRQFIFIFFFFCAMLWMAIAVFSAQLGEPEIPFVDPLDVVDYREAVSADTSMWAGKVINTWYKWDSLFFLKIAVAGYDNGDGSTAFAPLYPLLISMATRIFGTSTLAAALVLSNIFCLFAVQMFYSAAKLETNNKGLALRATLLFLCFPTTFFLFAAYPESLFLTLILATYLLARKKKYVLAGIFGMLATMTRFQGVLVVVLIIVAWLYEEPYPGTGAYPRFIQLWIQRIAHRLKTEWPVVVGAILPIAALVIYSTAMKAAGYQTMTDTYNQQWGNPQMNPFQAVWSVVIRISQGNLHYYDITNSVALLLFLAALIAGIRTIHPALWLYSLLTLGLITYISSGRLVIDPLEGPIFLSLVRYVVTLFPGFILFTHWLKNEITFRLVMATSLALQAVFLLMFLRWAWVG